MSAEKHPLNLPARLIALWLIVLAGVVGSAALSMQHYVYGATALSIGSIWAVRVVLLASMWLVKIPRDQKIFGIGLILLSMILDLLLKLPVLGSFEYGDWFLVSALDLSGSYQGYFIVWGLLLPLLTMTGWFVLRPRGLAGWITGLLTTLGMGFVVLAVSTAQDTGQLLFVLVTAARYLVPALLSGLADLLVSRFRNRATAKKSAGQFTNPRLKAKK